MKQKVFCIGLHKTGTSSLYAFAARCGYKAIHRTVWICREHMLYEYDFFSDGGSHFDGVNEFDFNWLMEKFPDSKFILQTRDPKSWVVSKLKHAGWRQDSVIEEDDVGKLNNECWKYKSLLHIEKFLVHKHNYERKVIDFFQNNAPDKLLVIDVTNKDIQESEVKRLTRFLGLEDDMSESFPHSNRAVNLGSLSDDVMEFIDRKVKEIWTD